MNNKALVKKYNRLVHRYNELADQFDQIVSLSHEQSECLSYAKGRSDAYKEVIDALIRRSSCDNHSCSCHKE